MAESLSTRMPAPGQALSQAHHPGGFDHRPPSSHSFQNLGDPREEAWVSKCETFLSWNQIWLPEDVKTFLS